MPHTKPARKPRARCKRCHNLDPRNHRASVLDDESGKASLTLAIDVWDLKRYIARRDQGHCRFCDVVVGSLNACWEGWKGILKESVVLEIDEGKSLFLRLGGRREREGVAIYVEGSASYNRKKLPWPTLGFGVTPPIKRGSKRTYAFIDECLKASKPQACSSGTLSSAYPTRILDVGSLEQPHIRLCRTEGRPIRYVALSHCWGNGPTLTTKLNNLASRKDEIDFYHLPPLFQDSVTLCRNLGIRFLWIDSLTIIQDSKHDWDVESHKMGSIYENAYFVISAVECGDSGQSILGSRQPEFKAHVLDFENTIGSKTRLTARRYVDHHANRAEGYPAVPTGPLMSRAWSLQEQTLCSRVFHFTASEIIFESRSTVCCECRPTMKPYPTTPGILAKMIAKQSNDKLFAKWNHIVNVYSLRKLSFPSDRLPALSGLAEKFQIATGSKYLAGLWVDNLIVDLLWSTAPFLQHPHLNERLENYRAPSFSWASIEAQVHYETTDPGEPLQPLAKILETSSILMGANPLGEVSAGYIRIYAPALFCVLIAPAKHDFHYYLKHSASLAMIEVCPDSLLVEDDVLCTVRRAVKGEQYRPFKGNVMCIAIANKSSHCAYGLVLGNALHEAEAWERLGMFSCDSRIFENTPKEELKIV